MEELEERIDAAYAARTHEDLAKLFSDLPDEKRRTAITTRRRRFGPEWYPFFAVNLMSVVDLGDHGHGLLLADLADPRLGPADVFGRGAGCGHGAATASRPSEPA